ncbi:helix-turn-helix transcriptional regulator [Paenibacillus sp. N4]|uniref:winged helix-turn-helix transcriptional regulator n=1 Tax=Paenibacillus vietnamensis TaxID=2590547 RepID=UPI001CD0C548|nr:helix-turn-helix domain-containing protein [Paenibacillus vietnamensis]MCA0756473.1 helix-turn-helix transcriptional regulator [Paenibacillus vietnamensis]
MEREEKQAIPAQCSIEKSLDVVGGKWSFLVIREMMFHEKKRFGELKQAVVGISSKSLTDTLRHLEASGVITRTAYPTVPMTVEYALTEKGHALHGIIHEMKKWGSEWA